MFQTALQSTLQSAAATADRFGVLFAREPSLGRQEMQANAKRAVPRATVLHFRRARNTPLCPLQSAAATSFIGKLHLSDNFLWLSKTCFPDDMMLVRSPGHVSSIVDKVSACCSNSCLSSYTHSYSYSPNPHKSPHPPPHTCIPSHPFTPLTPSCYSRTRSSLAARCRADRRRWRRPAQPRRPVPPRKTAGPKVAWRSAATHPP